MSKVVHIKSIDQWNEIVAAHESNGNILVCKCSANWCAPCKALAPKIESLAQTYDIEKVLFLSIDIEENEEIANKFNITSLPTTLIIKNCDVIKTIVGADFAGIKIGIDNALTQELYM